MITALNSWLTKSQTFFNWQYQWHLSTVLAPIAMWLGRNSRSLRLTTSRTSTRVASLLGFLVSSFAEVISAGVDNNGALCLVKILSIFYPNSDITSGLPYPQYALSADQLDQFVLKGTNGITLGISWNVTEITNVALAIARRPMRLPEWIDW